MIEASGNYDKIKDVLLNKNIDSNHTIKEKCKKDAENNSNKVIVKKILSQVIYKP
jgi:hypothetical protein